MNLSTKKQLIRFSGCHKACCAEYITFVYFTGYVLQWEKSLCNENLMSDSWLVENLAVGIFVGEPFICNKALMGICTLCRLLVLLVCKGRVLMVPRYTSCRWWDPRDQWS